MRRSKSYHLFVASEIKQFLKLKIEPQSNVWYLFCTANTAIPLVGSEVRCATERGRVPS